MFCKHKLPCFIVLQVSHPVTAHPSGQPFFSDSQPFSQLLKLPAYTCLTSCHLFGISFTQISHPLCSAHPELHLLHLQCKPLLQLRHIVTSENPLERSLSPQCHLTTQSSLLSPPGPIPSPSLVVCYIYSS